MKKTDRVDHPIKPDHWSWRGRGVKDGNKPLHVWSGIPGELARVRIVHRGQNRSHGLFVEPLEHHPHRVQPPCDRYDPCGGCPVMHVSAEGQEQVRRALVRRALDEEGLTSVPVGAFHPSPDGLEDFRHVVKVGFGYSDRGHIRVGAWGRRDRSIVPIPNCNVAVPVLNHTMAALAHHTIENRIRPWDPETDEGVLRSAVLRASRLTGEVLITLVAGRRVRELQVVAEAVAAQVTSVVGAWLHLNSEPGNAIFFRDEDGRVPALPLLGKECIDDRLNEVTYQIGPGDFFQTNPAMAEVLYRRIIERCGLRAETPVVDLYCGVGGLALQAAHHSEWALGVEEVGGAVTRAREAARRQGLNAEFAHGRVEEVLPDLAKRLDGRAPVVMVNPARRGLEPGVVEGILGLKPSRVAYVSCNPRALARDLVAFEAGGLQIGEVEMFDMFPNTAHVECVVTLEGEEPATRPGRAPRRKVVR